VPAAGHCQSLANDRHRAGQTAHGAIYLAYAGLLPEKPLPGIEIVFGALNSGGTADSKAQVLGLEVTCPPVMLTDSDSLKDPLASPRFKRWFENCGSAPEGWPCEAGYWIGMRIAEGYVAHARDKRAAIRELLELQDPVAILKQSRYGG
jgi:hypothetical protein